MGVGYRPAVGGGQGPWLEAKDEGGAMVMGRGIGPDPGPA